MATLTFSEIQNFSEAASLIPLGRKGPSTCKARELYYLAFNIHVRSEGNSRFNSFYYFDPCLITLFLFGMIISLLKILKKNHSKSTKCED